MQDRFKFRVWDKRKNNYIKDFVFNFINRSPYITVEYFDNEYAYTHTFEEDEIIIEQCTGLKNKDGKLIYEGDIVIKTDINGFGYPRTRICRVYWKEDWLGWVIETEYGDVYALGDYGSDNFEIIGNIHEKESK